MSVIDTRHNVFPFVAGTSKAFEGQRLAKVGYKTSKKNPVAQFPSVCASVPMIEGWTENQNQRLLPHFRTLIQDAQDKIFRSLYESAQGVLTSISDDDISVEQVIAFLESEATGDRLTKEKIGAWFDSAMRDNLTVVICEKLGTENTEDIRVTQHLAGYRGLFGSLSKDSGALQESQIKGLRKAIDLAECDDEISARLSAKLDAMLNRPKIEELLDL